MTSDYARTWTRQTAAAPWRTRENPQVVFTKHGMIAMNGGSLCSGSGCESTGPWALSGWVSDVWVSIDQSINQSQYINQTNQVTFIQKIDRSFTLLVSHSCSIS